MRTQWLGVALGAALTACSGKSDDTAAAVDGTPASPFDTGSDTDDGPGHIPIYVGDVEFRTDAEVELLEGYEVIQGSVGLLEGVTDLSPLYALEEITGSLRIEDTTTLDSLAGLENLTTIGVDFGVTGSSFADFNELESLVAVEGLSIVGTRNLTDLSAFANVPGLSRNLVVTDTTLTSLAGLDGLTEVRGYLNLQDNPALASLAGLENVAYVGNTFFIVRCPLLEDLHDLTTLTTLNDTLALSELPAFTQLSLPIESIRGAVQVVRLPELTTISLPQLQQAGELEIHGNSALTSLDAPLLTEVGGWFQIDDNDALTSIGDFSSLVAVDERVSITRNDALASLSGSLPALREVGENFDVHDNTVLPACDVEAVASALTDLGGLVVNTGNDSTASCD